MGEDTVDRDTAGSSRSIYDLLYNSDKIDNSNNSNLEIRARWGSPTASFPFSGTWYVMVIGEFDGRISQRRRTSGNIAMMYYTVSWLLVEISTKLRPPSVEVRSKSLPSFDTPVSNMCTYKLQGFDMTDPDCGRERWIHIRTNRFIIIIIYMYMCIYIYIYIMYTYMHNVCMCIYIVCAHTYIYIYIYIYTYVIFYIYVYIYIYIHRYIWIYIDIHYPQYAV